MLGKDQSASDSQSFASKKRRLQVFELAFILVYTKSGAILRSKSRIDQR